VQSPSSPASSSSLSSVSSSSSSSSSFGRMASSSAHTLRRKERLAARKAVEVGGLLLQIAGRRLTLVLQRVCARNREVILGQPAAATAECVGGRLASVAGGAALGCAMLDRASVYHLCPRRARMIVPDASSPQT
jgi:hypothetical protein